jgi:hypothetical protein
LTGPDARRNVAAVTGRRDRRAVRVWISHWGFATLVGAAAVLGLIVGTTVAVPADIPAVALQAAPVYRVEVGGALFAGLYLVAVALVLALHNRGFSEIGTDGVRAHDLGRLPEAVAADRRLFDDLAAVVAELRKGPHDAGD